MPTVELHFPVLGTSLPSDHGYALYSAISVLLPHTHEADSKIQIGPISGQYVGNGTLQIDAKRSRLRLRLPADAIPRVLTLAGKSLDIAGNKVRLGVPQVQSLIPAPALVARFVTIKHATEPAAFLEAARKKLDALGVAGEIGIPLVKTGERQGEPRRLVMRIKDKKVVGFPLQVVGLTAEESIRLQEQADSGTAFSRRKMGCGFFVPLLKGQP